jgi:hypothetical protein
MDYSEIMSFVAGTLQFIVAGYALRLNRLFGPARVGWSLFWAFLLLAMLHLLQSIAQFHAATQFGVEVEVMYALISLLLLISMVHMETLLKEHMRAEREEQRMRAELESQVKKQTAHLTRAIEELQSEIDERKRVEEQAETAHIELQVVSRQAQMAKMAAKVLESVGNMLKSVDLSASLVSDHVKKSKIANVVHVGTLIREHAADLGNFMAHDPRGQKLPLYIAELAEHLNIEQNTLLVELESLKKNLKEIVAMQQSYGKPSGAPSKSMVEKNWSRW